MSPPLQLQGSGNSVGGWDAPETVRYYEQFCERHDRYRLANAVLSIQAELFPGARVLDIGAGTGRTAEACLPFIGTTGIVHCVEPARAMREAGERRVRDPRIHWSPHLDAGRAVFDRIVCGAAIWQILPLETTFRELQALLAAGGALSFNIPSLYLGEADEPGGGDDPLLLRLPAELMRSEGVLEGSTGLTDAGGIEDLLKSAGFVRLRRWDFRLRLTQEALRDWLKIPVLTERLLPGWSPEERARRIDGAFGKLDGDSWRWERWTGWTAWKDE